jgi:hypothetical protein
MQIRFPVYVSSATLPRHKTSKRVLAILRDEFEIMEVNPVDYPIVARAEYRGSEMHEFRYRDGLFYSRLKIYTDQSLENSIIERFWRQTFVKQAQAAAAFHPREVFPRKVANTIIRRGEITREIIQLERVGRSMTLSPEGAAEVQVIRAAFQALMKGVLLIDGEHWATSPEPMLSVARISPGAMTHDISDFTNRRMYRLPNTHSLGRWVYTFRQHQEAVSLSAPSESHPLIVDIFEPAVFSHEVPVGFSLSLLRYLSEEQEFPKAHRKRLAAFVDRDVERDWNDVIVEEEHLLSHSNVEGHYRRSLEIDLERIDARGIGVPIVSPRPTDNEALKDNFA